MDTKHEKKPLSIEDCSVLHENTVMMCLHHVFFNPAKFLKSVLSQLSPLTCTCCCCWQLKLIILGA